MTTVLCEGKLLESAGFARILNCLHISEQGEELKVEDAIRQEPTGWEESGNFECILHKNAMEFLEKLKCFPITEEKDDDSSFVGVYLIYYVGKTKLYGNQIRSCREEPIYVGKSERDIFNRLKDHCRKIKEAKDLELTSFEVRIMTVDIGCYASTVESLLIKHYDPLWNSTKVKFSFGNGNDKGNNWYQYHVEKNRRVRKKMINRVRNYISSKKKK